MQAHLLVQLIEKLRYKPDSRGCDSSWRWGQKYCYWLKHSRLTIALGSAQPLTKMSTNVIFWEGGLKANSALGWQP
jgi:hypothetical protein